MPFLEEYTLLQELGQGAFASVYKVRHNKLGYIRAVRVLNTLIAHGEHDTHYNKFIEECKTLLRIGNGNTPHIVHLYQPKLLDHKALVEMDYIQGLDIAHFLKQNNSFVPAYETVRLALDISSALAYCHVDIYKYCMDRDIDNLPDDPDDGSKVLIDNRTRTRLINKYRVIHNDIHSGNIMRREDGSYVLLDFGLALSGNQVARKSQLDNGAPEFKAPEKWEADNNTLTTSSDIYSFGIVLYELLTGRVPFQCDKTNPNSIESIHEVSRAHKTQIPPDIFTLRNESYARTHNGKKLQEPDYPEWLGTMIMKCLAKNPADRFRDGKELFEYVESNAGEAAVRKSIQVLQDENTRLSHQEPKIVERIVSVDNPKHLTEIAKLNRTVDNLQAKLTKAQSGRKDAETKVKNLEKEIETLKNHKNKLADKQENTTLQTPGQRKDNTGSLFTKLNDSRKKQEFSFLTKERLTLFALCAGVALLTYLILNWLN